MNAQFASNELHRAAIVSMNGMHVQGAFVALEAQKMAGECRAKSAKLIAERANSYIRSLPVRMKKDGITDPEVWERAEKIIAESNSLV